jgi:hypothetical protein
VSNLRSVAVVAASGLLSACDPAAFVEASTPTDAGFISSIDNPDFVQTKVDLKPVSTQWNGTMSFEIQVTSSGHQISNGDLRVITFNGDGPALPNRVSGFGSVTDERLAARPDMEGVYSSSTPPARVDLHTQGLRLGYTPMNVQLARVQPNGALQLNEFGAPRVSLDPNVRLVPVQAVVTYHTINGDGELGEGMDRQALPHQLAFWDRVPSPDIAIITDGSYGEITSAIWPMEWYRRDAAGQYLVQTQAAPDTIWDKCGVQFRLVNYFALQVPLRNVRPQVGDADADPNRFWPVGSLNDAPSRDNLRLAQEHAKFWDGVVTAIFVDRVGLEPGNEVGRAFRESSTILVSLTDGSGEDGVVGHELGHLSGLGDAGGLDTNYSVMVSPGPGTEPTPRECARMNEWALNFSPFWQSPPPQDPNDGP